MIVCDCPLYENKVQFLRICRLIVFYGMVKWKNGEIIVGLSIPLFVKDYVIHVKNCGSYIKLSVSTPLMGNKEHILSPRCRCIMPFIIIRNTHIAKSLLLFEPISVGVEP